MRSHSNRLRSRSWRSWAVAILVSAALGVAALSDEKATQPKDDAGRISGKIIRDAGGEPAVGADVTLLLPTPAGQDYSVWPLPTRQARADENGMFAFETLPPGKYRIWATHEKLTSRRQTLRGELVVIPETGDQPKPLELRMVPGVAVTAIVKSQANGQAIPGPIPGAIVHFGWTDRKDNNFATDAMGRVTLQPLAPERLYIETWAEGFARESKWLNLESGSDADVEFLLAPGGNIEGVVRDATGNVVADVGLSVRTDGSRQQYLYVTTNEKGHYRLDHVPLDVPLEISLSKQEYLRATVSARATGPTQTLDLTIHPRPHGGSITGSVVDPDGRPVVGAELTNMGRSSNELRKATTDKEGKFRLENLFEGIHGTEVTVRARRFAPLRVKVKPGPAEKPSEINIGLDPGHALKGRVEDETGRPLERVMVYFADGGSPFSDGGRTETDKDGRFEFDSLPADCPFTFAKPGYSRIDGRRLELDAPDVIVLTMSPSGVLQGKVINATTGKPVRSFNVSLTFSPTRQPNDPTTGIRSDLVNPGLAFQSDQGSFKIGDLLQGMPFQVMVDAEGYEREVWERVVAERSDRAEAVEFKLAPIDPASLSTYRGRLLDAHGKPVAGAVLRLMAARERKPGARNAFPFNWQMIRTGQLAQQSGILRFLEGTTNAAGEFEFPRVPKDAAVQLAWWGTGIASGRSYDLELLDEKDRTAIEIELPAPAAVKVTIDSVAFPEIGQINVQSRDPGLEGRQLVPNPGQKVFDFADLAAGTYIIQVMGPFEPVPGGRPGQITSKTLAQAMVTVKAGEAAEVEFDSK